MIGKKHQKRLDKQASKKAWKTERQRGVCILCHQHVEKRCNSHVISKYFIDILNRGLGPGQKILSLSQQGTEPVSDLKKDYAMCLICEGIIEKYEKCGELFFKKGILVDCDSIEPHFPNSPVIQYIGDDFDYVKFRLFILSMIWRMAVMMYKHRRPGYLIGEVHQERIRQMLLTGDPGDPHMYEIMLEHTQITDRTPDKTQNWLTYPNKGRWAGNGMNYILFIIETWQFRVFIHSYKDERRTGVEIYYIRPNHFLYCLTYKTNTEMYQHMWKFYIPPKHLMGTEFSEVLDKYIAK